MSLAGAKMKRGPVSPCELLALSRDRLEELVAKGTIDQGYGVLHTPSPIDCCPTRLVKGSQMNSSRALKKKNIPIYCPVLFYTS